MFVYLLPEHCIMRLEIAVKLFTERYDNRRTREVYESVLRPLVAALGADQQVDQITPAALVQYTNDLQKRGYALATRNKHIKSIKTFFNWLIDIEEITRTPARAIQTKKPPRGVARSKAMTDPELERVLRYALHKPRDYALILFLADTGCRAGGAAGLRVQDIEFERRRATVTEKGDKTRPVTFGEDCAAAIRDWLLKRKRHGEYVFANRSKKLTGAQVGQIVRRACLKAGVRSLGSHSLRHRKGHQFADQRIAASVAATAMGHSDVTITLTNYYPDDYERAEQALAELQTRVQAPRIVQFKDGTGG